MYLNVVTFIVHVLSFIMEEITFSFNHLLKRKENISWFCMLILFFCVLRSTFIMWTPNDTKNLTWYEICPIMKIMSRCVPCEKYKGFSSDWPAFTHTKPHGPYGTHIKTQLLIPYGSQMGHKGFYVHGMPRFYPKPAWPIFDPDEKATLIYYAGPI